MPYIFEKLARNHYIGLNIESLPYSATLKMNPSHVQNGIHYLNRPKFP